MSCFLPNQNYLSLLQFFLTLFVHSKFILIVHDIQSLLGVIIILCYMILNFTVFIMHLYCYRAQRAEETLEKITYMAYTTFARGLLERDRFIFTLLLAVEVKFKFIQFVTKTTHFHTFMKSVFPCGIHVIIYIYICRISV